MADAGDADFIAFDVEIVLDAALGFSRAQTPVGGSVAELDGVVVNRTGIDTIGVSVGLYADTVETPLYLVSCDTTGAYSFGSVKMGSYILRAFIDVAADSLCGWYTCFDDTTQLCTEPCALLPDTLTIEPGDELELDPIVLEPVDRRKEAP